MRVVADVRVSRVIACRGVCQAQAKLDATRTRETARSARARTLAHIEVLKGNATAAKVAADASASLESERGMKLARVQLLQQLQVRLRRRRAARAVRWLRSRCHATRVRVTRVC